MTRIKELKMSVLFQSKFFYHNEKLYIVTHVKDLYICVKC